jgi:hypothetical protein
MRFLFAVLVLLAGCSSSGSNMSYAAFLSEINAGNVTNVEISSGRAYVQLEDPTNYGVADGRTLCVTLPQSQPQPQLIDLLHQHEVPFSISE